MKFLTKKNNVVYENIIKHHKNNKLMRKIILNDYNENWYKINYYMNDVLCISDIIRDKEF